MSTKCIGTFKPTDEANPYIGEKNNLKFVDEEKLEVVMQQTYMHLFPNIQNKVINIINNL